MAVPFTAEKQCIFRPPSLQNHARLNKVKIKMRVPTPYERDMYASLMLKEGVIHHTKRDVRQLMLAGIMKAFDEETAERYRNLSETLYQVEAAEQTQQQLRRARYIDMTDVPEDQQPTEDELNAELEKIKPEVVMPIKDRMEIIEVHQKIQSEYAPIVKVMSDLAEQEAKIEWLNIKHYVSNWEGLRDNRDTDATAEDPLEKHEAEYLRKELGADAWSEISTFIVAMMGIDQDEEKNLSLLLESMSAQTGSTTSKPLPGSKNGKSTAGRSGKTRKSLSPKTRAKPSASGTDSKKKAE